MPGEGNQELIFSYDHDATSSDFNKKFNKILKPGVYWGGGLTNPSGHDVDIANFILLIECSSGEMVRVQTSAIASVTVAEATPYIVYTLSWVNDENNAGTFRADSDDGNFNGNNIYENEIVLGKATYSGGVITGFDYTEKTIGSIDLLNNHMSDTSVHGLAGDVIGTTDTQTLSNKTIDSVTLNGDMSGTMLLDEDDFISDSATKPASQQSIKQYINDTGITNALTLQGMEPIDEDTMVSDSDVHLPTQQSTKAYVDSHTSLSAGVHGVTGDVVGRTDTQTLTNKTLSSPVINTAISGTAFLDEDDMSSNSNTKVASQQSIKYYIDKFHSIGDIKYNYDLLTIGATNPWYNLSNADAVLSTTNYVDFVPYLRAILLRYDPLNTNITDFDVTDWDITTNVATLTLANTTPENTLLLNLAEDQLVHGSYTNWRTIDLPSAIGDITAGEYAITGIDLTLRQITFDFTAGDNSGSGAFVVNFYPHRIVGSTTTARIYQASGRGFMTVGNNGDVDYIGNLRLRDTYESHLHNIQAVGGTGIAVETDATGSSVSGRSAAWGPVTTDPTVESTLEGDTETRPKTFNAYAYIYVGTYTP
jgi:hypothetical protein